MDIDVRLPRSLLLVNPTPVPHPLLRQLFNTLANRWGAEYVGLQLDGRPEDNPLIIFRSFATRSTISVAWKQFDVDGAQVGFAVIANAAKFGITLEELEEQCSF